MNNFLLLEKSKWLIRYSNIYIFPNFPKIHLALKIKLEENLYSLIDNIIRANINKGNIRNKHQKEILVIISLLDFYIGEIYNKKIIKKKRFVSFISCLNEIRKMTYGWIESEKKEQLI